MKVVFLGSGCSDHVDFSNYQSNILIELENNSRLLIDCGADIKFSLSEKGLSYKDIDKVLLTGVSFESAGGLNWLGLLRYFDPSCDLPELYLLDDIEKQLWDHYLYGMMSTLQYKVATLHTYFDVHNIGKKKNLKFKDLAINIINVPNQKSPGFSFQVGSEKVVFSPSMQSIDPEFFKEHEDATVLFQKCQTDQIGNNEKPHFEDLKSLPEAIKSKMWLYNFGTSNLPNAGQQGFKGFINKGEEFIFND